MKARSTERETRISTKCGMSDHGWCNAPDDDDGDDDDDSDGEIVSERCDCTKCDLDATILQQSDPFCQRHQQHQKTKNKRKKHSNKKRRGNKYRQHTFLRVRLSIISWAEKVGCS